jgi:hypothetical protein
MLAKDCAVFRSGDDYLFGIVKIDAVRHGRAALRIRRLLVRNAGLAGFSIQGQDRIIFDKGHKTLRLPGAPNDPE